jgi:hypothetical protein
LKVTPFLAQDGGHPLTAEELRGLFIGVPEGLWCIVVRERDGKAYVAAIAHDEATAEGFAVQVGGQAARKPPQRERAPLKDIHEEKAGA